jgi:Recombination endonuclease VII
VLGKGNSRTICKYGHPLTESNRVQKSKTLPNGRCGICRDIYNARAAESVRNSPEKLSKVREAQRKYRRRFREEHPESYLIEWLQYKYHMTIDTYNAKLTEQDNRCAICKVLFDKSSHSTIPCVDHDHTCCTGERACGSCNRGLICGGCNKGLGNFKDDKLSLLSAVEYLDNYAVRHERSS